MGPEQGRAQCVRLSIMAKLAWFIGSISREFALRRFQFAFWWHRIWHFINIPEKLLEIQEVWPKTDFVCDRFKDCSKVLANVVEKLSHENCWIKKSTTDWGMQCSVVPKIVKVKWKTECYNYVEECLYKFLWYFSFHAW